MYNLNELVTIRDRLAQNKHFLKSELNSLPEGFLYSYHSQNGKTYYGERIPADGNRKKASRTGISKDPVRLHGLVRKKYVISAIDAIDFNIGMLNGLIEEYLPSDEVSIMKEYIADRPEISDYIYSLNSLDDTAWANSFSSGSDMYTENLRSTSPDGVRMRSMGEIAIASRLDHYGIPYRYEAPLGIPEIPFIPDFTIRRPHDGRLIYWEHLGMVSNPEYMKHNNHKLDVYADYGIVQWRNLIVTFGTEDGGINMKIVDAMIHGWLL